MDIQSTRINKLRGLRGFIFNHDVQPVHRSIANLITEDTP